MAQLDAELTQLLVKKDFYEKNPSAGQLTVEEPIYIGIRYTGDLEALRKVEGLTLGSAMAGVVYASATLAGLVALSKHPQVESIQWQRRLRTTLDDSVPDINANQVWARSGDSYTGYTGRGVLVGIIDTGIDFRHQVFRKADGTSRVLRIWDQTLTAGSGETAPAAITTPSIAGTGTPLGYGVEYFGASPPAGRTDQINGALASPATATVRHVDTNGHGTHVAGIATGDGSQSGGCHGSYHYIGVATEADLLVVRLWGLTTGDPTPGPVTPNRYIIDAIRYLLEQARVLARPLAINLSLGAFTERMDGSDVDCTTVDALLTGNSAGRAIVFSAGNDGDAKFHATGTVPAGPATTLTLSFRILPSDTRSRSLVITYTGSNLQVKLTSPVAGAAGTIAFVASGASGTSATANGTGVNSLVSVTNAANRVDISLTPPGPTASPLNNQAGTWTLELKDTSGTATPFHAFCIGGSSHDRQSPSFLDHDTVRTTLNYHATGRQCIGVGAYKVGGRLSSFSSRGPTLDTPARTKPEICAPGEDITSAGLPTDRTGCKSCCCECCQDFYVDKSGTSQAAPHITGVIALMLHKNPGLTHTQLKAALVANPRTPPSDATPDELAGWGSGPVNAKAIVDAVTQVNPPVTRAVEVLQDAYAPLRAQLLSTERGPLFQRLFEKHFQEIFGLVQTNRRVATVWHRCKGPVWIRLALKAVHLPGAPVPLEVDGVRLEAGARRFLAVLKRYASAAFLEDVLPLEPELDRLRDGMTLPALIETFGRAAPVSAPQMAFQGT